jgi:hypothetical protein
MNRRKAGKTIVCCDLLIATDNHQIQSLNVNQVIKTKLTNRTQTSNTGETKQSLRITHYGVTTSPQAWSPRRNSGRPAGKPAAAQLLSKL